MLANSRLVSFSCSVMTGASTEMVSRLMKLISVARKIRPAIHHRSPWIPGVVPGAANCFSSRVTPSPIVTSVLLPSQRVRDAPGERLDSYRVSITPNGVRRSDQTTCQGGVPFGHPGSARARCGAGAGGQYRRHRLRAHSRLAEGSQGR